MKRILNSPGLPVSVETWSQAILWLTGIAAAWLIGQLLAINLAVQPDYPVMRLDAKKMSPPTLTGQSSGLFGYPPVEQTTQPPQITDAVEASKTKLDWVLQGVIVNANQAVAIIELSGKTKVVLEGEFVVPKIRLVKVLSNGILLDNRGVAEKLLLKQGDSGLMQTSPVVSASEPQILTGADQQRLTEIGQTLRKAPMSIGQFLRFQPINQKGRWIGVKIWSKNDKKLFKALGFAEGDLVTQVNGKTIDDMSKDPTLWKQFLTLSEFELVIDRAGELKTIQVNFN